MQMAILQMWITQLINSCLEMSTGPDQLLELYDSEQSDRMFSAHTLSYNGNHSNVNIPYTEAS